MGVCAGWTSRFRCGSQVSVVVQSHPRHRRVGCNRLRGPGIQRCDSVPGNQCALAGGRCRLAHPGGTDDRFVQPHCHHADAWDSANEVDRSPLIFVVSLALAPHRPCGIGSREQQRCFRTGAALVSLGVAYIAFRMVENPLRFNRSLIRSSRRTFLVGLAITVVTFGTAGVTWEWAESEYACILCRAPVRRR